MIATVGLQAPATAEVPTAAQRETTQRETAQREATQRETTQRETTQRETAQREADEQFEQGKQALKRGDWAAACERFRRSLQLDPTPSSHVKVARCHEHEGALRLAWGEYEQALEKLRTRATLDQHARELQDLVTSAQSTLAKKLGRLRVAFSRAVAEAGLVIDGQPITPEVAHSGILVEPGQHRVEASVVNYRIEPVLVQLAAGEQRTVMIELRSPSDATTPNPVATPLSQAPVGAGTPKPIATPVAQVPHRAIAPTSVSRAQARTTVPRRAERAWHTGVVMAPERQRVGSSGAQRWVGIGASGLGLAFFGVAGYFGIRTQVRIHDARENDHCNADYWCDSVGMTRLDEAERLQTQALVFTAAGTLLGATGIVLWATAPKKRTGEYHSAPKIGLRVSPWGSSVGGLF